MARPAEVMQPKGASGQGEASPVYGSVASGAEGGTSVLDGNGQWIGLNLSTRLALQNLGWTQTTFDMRKTSAVSVPAAMLKPFASLGLFQKKAVTELGFTEQSWDARVGASGRSGL
jgi:hypothetical protein